MHKELDDGAPVRLEIVYRDAAGKTISRPMDCPPTVKVADLGVRAGVPGHGRVTGVRFPGTQVGMPPHYTVAEAVPSGEGVLYLDVEWDPTVPPAAHPFVARVRALWVRVRGSGRWFPPTHPLAARLQALWVRVNAAIPDYPPASWYGMAILIGVALGVLLFLPQGNGTRNPGGPDRVTGPTPEPPVIVGVTPRPGEVNVAPTGPEPVPGGDPGTGQDGVIPEPPDETSVVPEKPQSPGDDGSERHPPIVDEPEGHGGKHEPPAPPPTPPDPLELLPPPSREAVAERLARAEEELRDGASPELAEDAGQIWQDARRIGDRALERRALVVLKRVARTMEMPFLLAAAHRGERALHGRTGAETLGHPTRRKK